MMVRKRLFDGVVAAACLIAFAPLIGATALLLAIMQGRPIFFRAQRLGRAGVPFTMFKFRTMQRAAGASGVTCGADSAQITPLGHILRRTRLDELPQLYNILLGEMSMVGPRPPDPMHGPAPPERPGATGLATLMCFRNEAYHLQRAQSAQQAEQIYRRTCLPRKQRVERIYLAHASLSFDLAILVATCRALVWPHAAAPRWLRSADRAARAVADLATVQQQMIQQNAGHHRLAHGHGADADAGVVTALGDDLGRLARFGDRLARLQD